MMSVSTKVGKSSFLSDSSTAPCALWCAVSCEVIKNIRLCYLSPQLASIEGPLGMLYKIYHTIQITAVSILHVEISFGQMLSTYEHSLSNGQGKS